MALLQLTRSLRRSPVSALAAVLTLSLTLGAGASIFAVVDAVLLTPPPFTNPDALVVLRETPIDDPAAVQRPVPYATFEAWRERASAVAAMEAEDGTNLTLTGIGPAVRLTANDVTAGFLGQLGVVPARGRLFEPGDLGRPLAIVSDAFWRGTLGSDPDVIGRQIVLGGRPHEIVGVLPERFAFALNPAEIWRPLPITAAQAAATGYRVGALARLAPGVSPADLGAALGEVSSRSTPPARAVATPVAAAIAGSANRTLGLLAGSAAVAVVLAFVNLAGLLIVRTIDRRRELAVRTALGARPVQIAWHVLAEAEALVALGIAGGVLLAWWMTPAVGRLALTQLGAGAARDVAMNWNVVAAVSLVAASCAAACALVPAWMAARRSTIDIVRRGATSAPRELALRRLFVAGEVALAFALLVSMALVGRSLLGLLNTRPGFDGRGVLTLSVSLPAARYGTDDRTAAFYAALDSALAQRLGPGAAAILDELPLTGDRGRTVVRRLPADAGRDAVLRVAGTGYFDLMRIPVRAGRPFDPRDNAAASPRVIVSESLAARLFGVESPVGREVRLGAGPPAEVIAVVGDVKHRALDELPSPTVYQSAWQAPSRSSHVIVRSDRTDADVVAIVREEVARLDADLPVYGVQSMDRVVAASPGVPARRVLAATFAGFALLAVVLGAIGLFGAVAHDVASRRAELALRMALGADARRILMATLGQGGGMLAVGLAAGGVLSLWAARALRGTVSSIGALDVVAIASAAALLLIVGLVAVLPAARRAARTDPLIALRSE
jgi:predicted permease